MNLRAQIMLLVLTCMSATATELRAQLVPPGSAWNYLDDGSDQGTTWQAPSFDDSAWAIGNAQLGYGEGDEATVVSFGMLPAAKHITTYFRHEFQVANPAAIEALHLHLVDDDGAVVYLNGVEVVRSNLPTGTIDYLTEASTSVGGSGNVWSTFLLDGSGLVLGSNVLAVELHLAHPDSVSISFDLELEDVTDLPTVRGPYLQMAGPDRLVLRWRTPIPTDSYVQVGAAPGSLTTAFHDPALTTEHGVTLTGLTSDTVYFYSVGETGLVRAGDDADHWFLTPPEFGTETPKRIWLLGDCGTGTQAQAAVRDAFLNFSLSDPADLVLLLGDNAYPTGNDGEYQTAVFDMYAETLRTTPFASTRGNHEFDPSTFYALVDHPTAGEIGGLASGTEAFYSFDFANIHFVCLDSQGSNRAPDGAMATWLEADLASTLQPWIIAFWHHPPYSKGSHDSDTEAQLGQMRGIFLPILEDYGVDMVFSGHSHAYERSFLIDGHYGLSTTWNPALHQVDGGDGSPSGSGAYAKTPAAHQGTVYTVAGSSGRIGGGSLDHPVMFTSQARLGSVVLDVDGNSIDVVFLDAAGVVQDSYALLTDPILPVLSVVNLTAGATATFEVRDTAPGNVVFLGSSLAGPGPTPSIFGDIALSLPRNLIGTGPSDALGVYAVSLNVPSGLSGSTAWFHAIEITAPGVAKLSNPLEFVVQ